MVTFNPRIGADCIRQIIVCLSGFWGNYKVIWGLKVIRVKYMLELMN